MELVVFDLDGTLLDGRSQISPYTRDTLRMLSERGIAYTVATGRTLHGARDLLEGHGFILPQVFKNGVLTWHPGTTRYTRSHLLTQDEVQHVLEAFIERGVAPFLFTLGPEEYHAVYHPPLRHDIERKLAAIFGSERDLPVLPLSTLPGDAQVTNVSAIGPESDIGAVVRLIEPEPGLVAYMGTAIEDQQLNWVDIHHHAGSKGNAIASLKSDLGVSSVICFGDSDNDLSLFELADESYAPENAKAAILAAATEVIGHHDADGIARFLRQRFHLD